MVEFVSSFTVLLLWLRVPLLAVKEKSLSDIKLAPVLRVDLEISVPVLQCEFQSVFGIRKKTTTTFFSNNTFVFPRAFVSCVVVIYRAQPPFGPIKTFADVRLIKVYRLDSTREAAAPMEGHNSRGDVSEIHKLWKKAGSVSLLSASNHKWHQTLCYCSEQAMRQGHGMNAALSPG